MVGARHRLGDLDAAIRHMAVLAELLDGEGEVLLDLAALLAERGEHERAERVFGAARQAEPDSLSVAVAFAGWLESRSRWHEACTILEACSRRHPSDIGVLRAHARVLMEMPEISRAVECLKNALAIGGDDADVLADLGDCQIMAGDLAEAERNFRRAVAHDRYQAKAYFGLAMLPAVKFSDTEVRSIETALSRSHLNEDDEIYFSFALGRHYEAARKFDRALTYFASGNKRLRQVNPYDIRADEARADAMIATVDGTRTVRAEIAVSGSYATPIFVLGMPRSGSSLVEQVLAAHSQVSGGGELTLFGNAVRRNTTTTDAAAIAGLAKSAARLRQVGSDYLARARADRFGTPFFTDKTPQNFFYVGLIAAALPGAKIVHVRRDPTDTCVSCFTSLFGSRQRFANDLADIGRYYGLYRRLMAHWRELLREAVIDVDYEDFVSDLETETRRLLDALGLPFEPGCLAFHESSRSVTTHSAAQVRSPIYASAVGRWRGYAGHLDPLIRELDRTDAIATPNGAFGTLSGPVQKPPPGRPLADDRGHAPVARGGRMEAV